MSRLDEHLFWVVGAGAKYTFTSLHSAQGGRQPAQVGRGGDGAIAYAVHAATSSSIWWGGVVVWKKAEVLTSAGTGWPAAVVK